MGGIERYTAPSSMEQALHCLREEGGEVTILAGGTDLMPQHRAGRLQARRTLMNIRRIAELRGVTQAEGAIHIGALTTITELMDDPLVRRWLPVLAEAGDRFASNQIRNVGTLGGNVCNASPAGDMLVPLLVLGARVELASAAGGRLSRRQVPLTGFLLGPGQTARSPSELLTGVHVPLPPRDHLARFSKFGTRPALDVALVSVGIGGALRDGALHGVRVAYGAVAATPMRAPRTEAALEGRRLDAATIEAAAGIARDEVSPIDDLRASAWYRRELVHTMTKRMLGHVAQG
jgi:CO/xanthine dehydrogenase FAD-binding subunit